MKISLIASLYKTDQHIKKWSKWVVSFAEELTELNVEFEVIIVANEPTDKEKVYLEKLKAYNWMKVLEVPRETIYASWNRGINVSTGEVYGFINADDIRFAESIVEGIEQIKKGADFVYFPFIYKRYVRVFNFLIPAKRKVFKPVAPEEALKVEGMPYGPFWLISKKFMDRVGQFDESFKVAGDYEWSKRTNTQGNFVLSDIISGIFTSDGKTLSGSRSLVQASEVERIRNMYNQPAKVSNDIAGGNTTGTI